MLRTRLWMGSLLIVLAVGVLVLDVKLEPWYPILFLVTLAAGVLACWELVRLLPAPAPRLWLCQVGVVSLYLANWLAHLLRLFMDGPTGGPWPWVAGTLTAFLLGAFLVEAACYREPGGTVVRLSLTFWVVGYLGLLACFFVQLRWLPGVHGSLALALAIFIPKCCDIGAYFTGRLLGRHRMAPVLSPKKTWEGAAGGLLLAVLVAVAINALGTIFHPEPLLSWPSAAGLGLAVGALGMLGDLMESLIKRDCQRKDASEVVPGFGGVLDVLDSILFSAPLTYWWIRLSSQ
jgi:phosphatidate cytidylyltransferase